MAALIGSIQGNRGEASRLGSKSSGIRSRLATWNGAIHTRLEADGTFTVTVTPFGVGQRQTIRGNVDTGTLISEDEREGVSIG